MGSGSMSIRRGPVKSKELQELSQLRVSLASDPDQLKLCSDLVVLHQRVSRLKDKIRVEENSSKPNWQQIASMKEKKRALLRPMKQLQHQVNTYWRRVDRLDQVIQAVEARQ